MTREEIRKGVDSLVWKEHLADDVIRGRLYAKVLEAIMKGRGETADVLASYAILHTELEIKRRATLPAAVEVEVKGKLRGKVKA